MPRLIRAFAGCTLILMVLSCRGSFNTIYLLFVIEAKMDDTGAYKVEISNESGAASGAFKMKVVSKLHLLLYLVTELLCYLFASNFCTVPMVDTCAAIKCCGSDTWQLHTQKKFLMKINKFTVLRMNVWLISTSFLKTLKKKKERLLIHLSATKKRLLML